jgi:hypothetical protein
MRMPGRGGQPMASGGILLPPGPGDPALAAEIIAASDARDARPLDEVGAEIHRRAGGSEPPSAPDARGPAQR